ncbi:type II CAAX endopeptidase family protein [Microbacterium marmarense]|uniref:Type II CAAX endopeptidase family protein n=1 Tax=Microbacterium marmarense TaxID=3122051 RepID=A0ABU8LVV9_9MICO
MPDHSIDVEQPLTRAELRAQGGAAEAEAAAMGGDYRRAARTDWREGGRSVRRWRETTLAVAFLSLGFFALGAAAIDTLVDARWAPLASGVLLWIGMAVPIVWAFSRSRPAGLLRFRAVDLLYAVVLGVALRVVAGWIEVGLGGSGAFPRYTTLDGSLGSQWLVTDLLGPVLVAPLLEEFFFRAVLLVSVYTVLRRPVGRVAAGVTAVIVSSAVFMLVHAFTAQLGTSLILSIELVGLVCSLLVMLTGRIWGAVLVHLVFNASFVVLALVGTFWT